MTFDRKNNSYKVRNPLTGKRVTFENEATARTAAGKLNEWLVIEARRKLLDDGRPRVSHVIKRWREERLPYLPWDTSTREGNGYRITRIETELGERPIADVTCSEAEEWLKFCGTADQFNGWRRLFCEVWEFAYSKRIVERIEVDRIQERSTSKKLAINRKKRQRLEMQGFVATHTHAPAWLQIAMEQSLVTLQSRLEVCNMKHTDYRTGYLYVIRDKTSADSDMAFIKIKLTDQLEDIRRRALKLDDIVSPFLIHRRPDRARREWMDGKAHWSYINPNYVSRAFQDARDASGYYKDLEPDEKPSFHEIRSLGARIYQAQGKSKKFIQMLMTHASAKTTEIYLEGGAQALTDDDYVTVAAPLTLASVWSLSPQV
jgi:integrase